MKRPESIIVGAEVPDQATLRVPKAVKDLDEFLDFLEQLEKVFGSIERAPQITKGDRFLL